MIVTENDIKRMVTESVKKVINELNSLLCYSHWDAPDPEPENCNGYIENFCCDLSEVVKKYPQFYKTIRQCATSDLCDEVYVGRVDVSWERRLEGPTSIGGDDYDNVDEYFNLQLSQDNPLSKIPELSDLINKIINEQFDPD